MQQVKVKKEQYTNVLVNILFRWDEDKMHPHSLFIQELVKHSHNGHVNRDDIRPILRDNLRLSEGLIRKTLNILVKKNHIRIIGVTIYLHPKYNLAKICKEMFIISPKA